MKPKSHTINVEVNGEVEVFWRCNVSIYKHCLLTKSSQWEKKKKLEVRVSWFGKRQTVLPVHCLPVCAEDRRWIKPWMSDLLAAAVTLLRWITTHDLWPHLPESSLPQCGTEGVPCVWTSTCVCVGQTAGQLYVGDRMGPLDQWANEQPIS